MRPSSHGCSISDKGATVVLPAPGCHEQRRTAMLESVAQLQDVDNRKVASRCGQHYISAECWRAVTGPRVAGNGNGRADPSGRGCDLLGDFAPLSGVPSLGEGLQRAIEADEHERGQLGESESAHERAVGVAVHKELLGQRTEERLGSIRVRGDDEVDPGVGSAKAFEDARCSLEDPRALVGVRIEHTLAR